RAEFLLEKGDVESEFGDLETAERAFRSLVTERMPAFLEGMSRSTEALILIRQFKFVECRQLIESLSSLEPTYEPGHQSRLRAIKSPAAALDEDSDAAEIARQREEFAERQGSVRHQVMASLSRAAVDGHLGEEIMATPSSATAVISAAAELVV